MQHAGSRRKARFAALLALAGFAGAASARASGPLGPNGATIATSDYAIDLYQGPVFAGTRVTGMSGAYVAISEDVDGNLQNPASPAVRPFYSIDYFDYWLGLGLTFPATLKNMDFFNSGNQTNVSTRPDSFVFIVPAINLQWGQFGVGGTVEVQEYALSQAVEGSQGESGFTATVVVGHPQVAYGFWRNQFVMGAGVRYAALVVDNRLPDGSVGESFNSAGTGTELGFVYKPEGLPFRVGGAMRGPVRTEASYRDSLLPDANGDLTVIPDAGGTLYLPRAVALPGDVNVGIAVQLGGRPLNPRFRTVSDVAERETLRHQLRALDRSDAYQAALAEAGTEDEAEALKSLFQQERQAEDADLERRMQEARKERERELATTDPFYLLVSASMVVASPVENAVGVESFLAQRVNRSGTRSVVSPRIGLESEVVPGWMKARAGSYLEPTRFSTSTSRLHGTLGVDLRVLRWNGLGLWPDNYVWRVGIAGDASNRYFTWGFSVGGWYPRDASN